MRGRGRVFPTAEQKIAAPLALDYDKATPWFLIDTIFEVMAI
ncbi:hypothetical protein EC9_07800 [Rosistilla ulvae]|uniref:Uncharacterized protein n=1 Tax=Rosistilla ulvae TaxID=1930277 RepID=A0A517LVF2_9BACT|nr:hypothetical protein EC9_07800 [Rosistilla ulvae]